MNGLAMAAWMVLSAGATPGAAADPWKDLAPLVGDWVGVGTGQPGEGSGGFTLGPELGGHVLVRKSFSEYPATKEKPASRHEDLMVIFREGGAVRATYWDNEGHVIHYAVQVLAQERRAVFLGDAGQGPRFRLTYDWTAADALKLLFEIAPPGTPEKFSRYLEATARRRHK